MGYPPEDMGISKTPCARGAMTVTRARSFLFCAIGDFRGKLKGHATQAGGSE